MHSRFALLLLALTLLGCNTSPQKPLEPNFIGLLKVTISGIGDGATPTANAEWVKGGVSSQSATVLPINGTSGLGDVQISRGAVNFSDDDHTNTRYVYSTFDLTNRSTTNFSNFTLYAVNVPTNIGGTALASMTAATGTAITSEGVARGFQPIHTLRGIRGGFEVNPAFANLQLFTPGEATDIKNQAVLQGILSNTANVLEYGFVAENTTGGRTIGPRNLSTDCTDNSCKGYVTLAYKFPRISPRQNNPFSFVLYFVVANETNSYVSQSLEEQAANTIAGLTNTTGFAQTRIIAGSNFGMGLDDLNNLCQVKTAVATTANPSSVLMPSSLPAAIPGSLDVCFGAGGRKTTTFSSSNDLATAVAIQSDGKIVLAGNSNTNVALARYNPNASLDPAFDGDGKVTTGFVPTVSQANALALQSDGKIVVAGSGNNGGNDDFALARYNPDGSLDTTFDTDGKVTTAISTTNGPDSINAIAIQSDGKIIVAGYSQNLGNNFFALARYNPDGSLDTAFGLRGKVGTDFGSGDDQATALALQSDGKIVVAGYSSNGSNDDFALARYNPDGSLDTAFDSDGKLTATIGSSTDRARSLAVQNDGKIVVAGYTSNGSNNDIALARYNPNGSLDSTFGTGGKVTTVIGSGNDDAYALALQSNGKIVVAGSSSNGANGDFALTRYNLDGSLDISFGTLGKVVTGFSTNDDFANALAIQGDGKIVVAGFTFKNGILEDFALARYNP